MKSFLRMVLIVTLVVTIGGIGGTLYIYRNQDKFYLPFIDSYKFKEEFESINGLSIKDTNYVYSTIKVNDNNHYRYATFDDVFELLDNGTGIIFIGYKYSLRSRSMVNALDNAVGQSDFDDIYYLDIHLYDEEYEYNNGILEVKTKGSKDYYKLVKKLDDSLPLYKNEYKRISYPTVIFVSEGEIVGVHIGTIKSHTNPYYSLTNTQEKELIEIYKEYIDKLKRD